MLFCFALVLKGRKGNEQHISSQTDPPVGLLRNMLLVSAFLHLGRNNRMKYSTHDDTTRVVLEHVACSCLSTFR